MFGLYGKFTMSRTNEIRGTSMKNLFKTISLSTLILMLISCGSGVKDRPLSTSTSQSTGNNGLTLTASEIDALAETRIASELYDLGIEDFYLDSKSKFPNLNFLKLSDFLSVQCADSKNSTTVNNYKNYGKLLQDTNTQDHVVAVIDNVSLILNSEEQKNLSANQLAVLLKSVQKLNTYRDQIASHATKCKNVKQITTSGGGQAEPVPVNPPADN
jgi:hypothetical protein